MTTTRKALFPVLALGAACLTTAFLAARPAPEPSGDPVNAVPVESDRFVVHEWGTFTSFSGSDGRKLEFRPLVDQDLPLFVLDRGRQAGTMNLFSKTSIRVLQRMETPITYFYTDRERDVRVRVGFPEGLLTEFYPPIAEMAPAYNYLTEHQLEPKDSSLDWGTVHLIPEDRLATDIRDPEMKRRVERKLLEALLPGTRPLVNTTVGTNWGPYIPSTEQEHYFHARETDSAIVHVRREPNKLAPQQPTGDFFEKFLFYRGVGNFGLPLELTARGGDVFDLRNDGPDPVRSLFLVTVDEETIRYRKYDGVDSGETIVLKNDAPASSVDALATDVEAALVAEGLYAKEAAAMVNTWRESWFGERGTRLFYVVPHRLTDELLPLHLDPVPDEVVRVLVGRMEIMSPEDEARVLTLIRESADRRATLNARADEEKQADPVTPAKMITPLAENLGRLLEPGLVRAKHIAEDPIVKSEATWLLYELKQYHETLAATAAK